MELKPGDRVSINPQNDRTRKARIDGVVAEVLTKNPSHPHGIKVKLETGEIGRVKEEKLASETESNAPAPEIPTRDLSMLIAEGESQTLEFKTSAMWSKFFTKEQINASKSYELRVHGQKASYFILAKSIAGFANAGGGFLIIGIKEEKDSEALEIAGIDSEFQKLKDQTVDGYRRMLVDEVVSKYLPNFVLHHLTDYIELTFDYIREKRVCVVAVKASDRPVFLKGPKEVFFVRIDASTREISGQDILNYCQRRFSQ